MKKHIFVAVLSLALSFSCASSSIAAADDPARLTALEQGKAEAATLLEQDDAEGAYALSMRLLREAPEDDGVNLTLARAATKIKRWNQAVLAYETLLEKYPREAALYGELAHVYMLLGDREAAERNVAVMRALGGASAGEDPGKTLDMLERRYSDLQIHGKVRAGLLYDSNANLGPESNDLSLGSWRVRVDGARAKETFGAYLGADLDVGWRPYRDGAWWLVGDVQTFWRGNAESGLHDTRSRESQWGRGSAGVRHLTASTLAEVRLKAEIFDYELYQNVSAYGPEGTFLWAATPSFHLIFKGGLDQREYSRDHSRNGQYGYAGMYGRFFFGADNHEFLVGGRYLGAAAEKSDYGYNGWETMARMLFKLPYDFELAPFVSWTQEHYNGPATALEGGSRLDERLRLGLGLTYRITKSWAVESTWQYTKNYSNSALYEYDQHFANIGVVWSF